MIDGIGIDVVDIERFKSSLDRTPGLIEKLFTENERTKPISSLAARFAAKEACAKALGTGIRDGITFQDMVVSNDPLGKPILTLYNKALERLEFLSQGKGFRIDLSLSDEYPMSVAFVIISME